MAADDDHSQYDATSNSNFQAMPYLKQYYASPKTDPTQTQIFVLKEFHSFYEKYAPHDSKSSLLEFGGGPALYSLISAAKHIGSITFSEYAELNRNEVLQWRDGGSKRKPSDSIE